MISLIWKNLFGTAVLLSFTVPLYAAPALPNINTNNVVLVTDAAYGAVGDGVTTNTAAIQAAINKAAAGGVTNGAAGGTVEIPAGTFLSGPLALKSAVNLHLDAGAILRMLPFGQYPGSGNVNGGSLNFIGATNVQDVEISGSGAVDGQGAPWWHALETNSSFLRPIMIRLQGCSRQLIEDVTLSNSPMFHISISGNRGNATVQGVTIRAPSSSATPASHNTDACDVSGTNILVQNCNISVGDDDFTCSGGTSGVLLTNNTYGNGHGVSIGSYTDGGVSNITVINCTFNGTDNGIRIKSDNDRGGLVQNISYLNIGMTNVNFPIQVYGYYNEIGTPRSITPYYAVTQDVAAVTGSTPFYRNITFSNINATSVSGYPIGILWARTEAPATNIVFDKVNVSGDRNFCLYNVTGAKFIDCNFAVSSTWTTFALFNADAIFTNSVSGGGPFTFDGMTTNGYGNDLAFYGVSGSLKNTNTLGDGPLTLAAGVFTVSNNLSLSPASVLNFTLGTNAAELAVTGSLALAGTVNISAGQGFAAGLFTLMTYGGALTGALPAIGMAPAGYNYSFDTNTPGVVTLVVASAVLQPPLPPATLTAAASDSIVLLNWSPSATATNYDVKRSLVSGGSYSNLAVTASTNYSDTTVANGTTYYYVVAAVNAAGEGTNSPEASATPERSSFAVVTTNVFDDNFVGSTLNSTAQTPPEVAATSYELISSKSWNPAPSIGADHLQFGISPTTSGSIEAQALFTSSPVTLMTNGDSISLIVTFTNASGLLTQSGALSFGVYNSGQSYPVAGGLNGVATTTYATNTTGGAQLWQGYVGQVAFTGSSSQIITRPAQTVGTLANNDQDILTSGSGSSSFKYPTGSSVGSGTTAASVTLTAATPYTDVLTISLASAGILAVTNTLYDGTDTNSTPLSQFGGVASGGTYLTNSFDALAVGWRATTNTSATAININHISVISTLTVATVDFMQPPEAPLNLEANATNLAVALTWNAVSGATNYVLRRGTVSGFFPTVFNGVNSTNYTDADVTNAVKYFYVVAADGVGGESTNSLPVSAVPLPSTAPASLAAQVEAGQLELSWPQDHLGWRLQIQTNTAAGGLSTNWFTVPNSTNVMAVSVPVNSGNGCVFLRLIYP